MKNAGLQTNLPEFRNDRRGDPPGNRSAAPMTRKARRMAMHHKRPNDLIGTAPRRQEPRGMGTLKDEARDLTHAPAKSRVNCVTPSHNSRENTGKHGLFCKLCNRGRGPLRQVARCAKTRRARPGNLGQPSRRGRETAPSMRTRMVVERAEKGYIRGCSSGQGRTLLSLFAATIYCMEAERVFLT